MRHLFVVFASARRGRVEVHWRLAASAGHQVSPRKWELYCDNKPGPPRSPCLHRHQALHRDGTKARPSESTSKDCSRCDWGGRQLGGGELLRLVRVALPRAYLAELLLARPMHSHVPPLLPIWAEAQIAPLAPSGTIPALLAVLFTHVT